MAEQDFAQIEVPTAPPRSGAGWRIVLVGLAVAIVAAAFGGGYYLGMRHGAEVAAGEEKKRLLERIRAQQEENERLRKALAERRASSSADASPFGEDRLLFFDDLPKEPVATAPLAEPSPPPTAADAIGEIIRQQQPDVEKPDAASPAPAPQPGGAPPAGSAAPGRPAAAKPAIPAGGWRVQAASFRKRAEAKKLAEKLRAGDFAATVEQADLGARGVWWRVFVGPFGTRPDAEDARHALHERFGIRGLVVRIRR